MIDMIIQAAFLGIVLAVLYGIYLIPPVKRLVKRFANMYWEFLFTVGFAASAAAMMYFVVLPRI